MPHPAPDLVTVAAAAAEKGCTPQAIRAAIGRGALGTVRLGPRATMVRRDADFRRFSVQNTGRRARPAARIGG
jgi:hypothetical protein